MKMLGFTRDDLEASTKPLCSMELFERKYENYLIVEHSFAMRDENCAGLPIELNLEPSGNCNLRCQGCPRGRGRIKRSGNLPYAVFEMAISQIGETLCNIFISGFGEPLCNPETPRMIALATNKGISTVMNTNGTFLKKHVDALLEAQLTLINIALDGATANSYHEYISAEQFEITVHGVEYLRQRKDQLGLRYPTIEGQFLIREDSLSEINRLEKWAKGIGIERVKFKRPYLSTPGEEDHPAVESVTDYLRALGLEHVKSTEKIQWTPSDCALPWENILLSCTGQIGICCYDPHLRLQLNEPHERFNIIDLWNGEKIRQVRRWLSNKEENIVHPCARCNRMPGYLIPMEKATV
jgi:pyruvate-formate lyase-activating enzyme